MSFPTYFGQNVPIFTWEPNWADEVTLDCEYRTLIAEGLDTSEERIVTRPRCLYGLKYSVLTTSARETARLRGMFEPDPVLPVGMPIWPEALEIREDIPEGAMIFEVEDFTGGLLGSMQPWVLCWHDWDNWAVLKIDTIEGSTINLAEPAPGGFGIGDLLVPLAFGHVKRPQFSHATDEAAFVEVDFKEAFFGQITLNKQDVEEVTNEIPVTVEETACMDKLHFELPRTGYSVFDVCISGTEYGEFLPIVRNVQEQFLRVTGFSYEFDFNNEFCGGTWIRLRYSMCDGTGKQYGPKVFTKAVKPRRPTLAFPSVVQEGLPIDAVACATTEPIARLTGLQVVDGYQLTQGDTVLVKNQGNAIKNGVYYASSGDWSKKSLTHDVARKRTIQPQNGSQYLQKFAYRRLGTYRWPAYFYYFDPIAAEVSMIFEDDLCESHNQDMMWWHSATDQMVPADWYDPIINSTEILTWTSRRLLKDNREAEGYIYETLTDNSVRVNWTTSEGDLTADTEQGSNVLQGNQTGFGCHIQLRCFKDDCQSPRLCLLIDQEISGRGLIAMYGPSAATSGYCLIPKYEHDTVAGCCELWGDENGFRTAWIASQCLTAPEAGASWENDQLRQLVYKYTKAEQIGYDVVSDHQRFQIQINTFNVNRCLFNRPNEMGWYPTGLRTGVKAYIQEHTGDGYFSFGRWTGETVGDWQSDANEGALAAMHAAFTKSEGKLFKCAEEEDIIYLTDWRIRISRMIVASSDL